MKLEVLIKNHKLNKSKLEIQQHFTKLKEIIPYEIFKIFLSLIHKATFNLKRQMLDPSIKLLVQIEVNIRIQIQT